MSDTCRWAVSRAGSARGYIPKRADILSGGKVERRSVTARHGDEWLWEKWRVDGGVLYAGRDTFDITGQEANVRKLPPDARDVPCT